MKKVNKKLSLNKNVVTKLDEVKGGFQAAGSWSFCTQITCAGLCLSIPAGEGNTNRICVCI